MSLIKAVFHTWTKTTSLAKVYIFPVTLGIKSIWRVSRFQLGLISEDLPSSFTPTRRSGPSSPTQALQGALAVHPMPWSLWSLSKKERMVSAGGLFFTLSEFLLPLPWNLYLKSMCSYRAKCSRCLCPKFMILCSCVTSWNSLSSPEALLSLILLGCRWIMIF